MVVVIFDLLLMLPFENHTSPCKCWHRSRGVEVAPHAGPHVVLPRVARYVLRDRNSLGQDVNSSTQVVEKRGC